MLKKKNEKYPVFNIVSEFNIPRNLSIQGLMYFYSQKMYLYTYLPMIKLGSFYIWQILVLYLKKYSNFKLYVYFLHAFYIKFISIQSRYACVLLSNYIFSLPILCNFVLHMGNFAIYSFLDGFIYRTISIGNKKCIYSIENI